MKILILGGDGMVGHQLFLGMRERHDVRVTLRQSKDIYKDLNLFNASNSYYEIDAAEADHLTSILDEFQPDAVINAIGVIKQRPSTKDTIANIVVNALAPNQIEVLCSQRNIRFVHFSTDCVFSGSKGNYKETDLSDAKDVYGKTKYLGEVNTPSSITIRTSFIGLELNRKASLLEWFLSQSGRIKGYRKAIFSGLTTIEMSKVVEMVLVKFPELHGVWHVASQPINKYELLTRISTALNRKDVEVEPDDQLICDRSLNAETFYEATNYKQPAWDHMIADLVLEMKNREKQGMK